MPSRELPLKEAGRLQWQTQPLLPVGMAPSRVWRVGPGEKHPDQQYRMQLAEEGRKPWTTRAVYKKQYAQGQRPGLQTYGELWDPHHFLLVLAFQCFHSQGCLSLLETVPVTVPCSWASFFPGHRTWKAEWVSSVLESHMKQQMLAVLLALSWKQETIFLNFLFILSPSLFHQSSECLLVLVHSCQKCVLVSPCLLIYRRQ